MKVVKVVYDSTGTPTISPPDKQKDNMRENLMTLRRTLHRDAYQNKVSKKAEMHMVDILTMLDKHVRLRSEDGTWMNMSETAKSLDPVAYLRLTDVYVEAKLVDVDISREAAAEYEKRFVRRQLMHLVGEWTLPSFTTGEQMRLPENDIVL